MTDTPSITLPDVTNTAPAPAPAVSTLSSSYAVRKITLTFTLASGATLGPLTGLRVNAHLEKVVFPHMGSVAILHVYGLTIDHMNQLSVAGLLFKNLGKNTVKVEAGDDTSGMLTVFQGDIQEAYPDLNSEPDSRHFYIYATISVGTQLAPTTPTSYPSSVPASTTLTTLAQQMGYTLKNNGVTAVLASPYLPGTVWQQIQSVIRAVDCLSSTDGVSKTLTIWPKNNPTAGSSTITVAPPPNGTMIGYPMFQTTQIIVKDLFKPTANLYPGVVVLVQSQLAAANNAKINLNFITHDLESQHPGGLWETTMIGNPINASNAS